MAGTVPFAPLKALLLAALALPPTLALAGEAAQEVGRQEGGVSGGREGGERGGKERGHPGGGGEGPRGMTWAKAEHNRRTGTDLIACGGICDAYVGDTLCSEALPVLCIKKDSSPNPGLQTDFYTGWSGGHVATTLPIQGSALGSAAQAHALCARAFGPGWGMAEFHDAQGGWAWYAFGDIRDDTRVWVFVDDQPQGNCFPLE